MVKGSRIKEFGAVVVLIFVFAYLLNFFWESFHAVFLYEGHNFNAIRYVPMIGYVSMVDGLLILGMYLIVSLFWRNFLWINEIDMKKIGFFAITGLLIAAWIEYRGVFLQARWSYNSLMPTIFGIGLSPLLQLAVTGAISLWLTKRLLFERGIFYGR